MSGNSSGFLSLVRGELWKSGTVMTSLHLDLKRLSWTPVLGAVQGQGRQYMVQLGRLKGPGQTPDWELA